jgi:ketosteroid isomerase-like protein
MSFSHRSPPAELVEALLASIDRMDWSTLARCLDEDVVYDRPGYDRLTGLPAVLDFYRRVRVIGKGSHTLHGLVVEGDTASCWGTFSGFTREGEPIPPIDFADWYTIRDGLISNRRTFFYVPAI